MRPSLSVLLPLAVLLSATVTWAAVDGGIKDVGRKALTGKPLNAAAALSAAAAAANGGANSAIGGQAALETAFARAKAAAKSIRHDKVRTAPSHKPLSRAATTKAKKKEVAARGGRRLDELVSGDSVGNYEIQTKQGTFDSFFTEYDLVENESYFKMMYNFEDNPYQVYSMPVELSFFETIWGGSACISSTGYMAFCDSDCDAGNWDPQAIPEGGDDVKWGAMLAPFWSDLSMTVNDGSEVNYGWHHVDGSLTARVFFQWKDIAYWIPTDGDNYKTTNFEVEFTMGFDTEITNIRIRYFGLDDFPLDQSYTAGLQDSDGTTGLSFTLPDATTVETDGSDYEVEFTTSSSSDTFEYVDCDDNTPSPAGYSTTWGGYSTAAPVSWTTNYEGSMSEIGAHWNLTVGMEDTEDCIVYEIKACISGGYFGDDDCSSSTSSSSDDDDDSSSSSSSESLTPGGSFDADFGFIEGGSGEHVIKWYISTNEDGSVATGDYTMLRIGFGVDDDESVYSSHTYASADGGIHSSMEMFYEEHDDGADVMMSINVGCGAMTPSPAGFATASPTASPDGFGGLYTAAPDGLDSSSP